MHIRMFQPDDESAVIQLWDRSGLTRSWNDPRKDICRKQRVQPEWFLVGVLDERIIVSVMAGFDGHRGWINYLVVDPDFQRAGHARAIMVQAERMLHEFGCPKINLQIRKNNLDAIAFYENIGFTEDAVVSYGKRLIPDE
ncbi:MAG: GNAT family acetyltransferase [Planctomycetes bacterium]|nr:GNAT family acetyltransferase [Planctomycetota bacterium]